MTTIIPVTEYMARWAYGELGSDRFSDDYQKGLETKSVCKKAQTGVDFGKLSADERALLVGMLKRSFRARPDGGILSVLDGVSWFRLTEWTKKQLLATRVVAGPGAPKMEDYYNSMGTIPVQTLADCDPRKRVAALGADVSYAPAEPICIIPYRTPRLGSFNMLLEGTARALTFIKLAKADETISVWVPTDCPT